MPSAIIDCLNGQHDNYILPFLWLHGEEEDVLRDYMHAIDSAGIKGVCLESRPHPDFLGEQWWHDLDIILDEARKRNMKVWILDDKHFPTGQAGGTMEKAPIELQKQYLGCNMVDVYGPQRHVRVSVNKLARTPFNPLAPEKNRYDDDELFAVVAARLDGDIDRSLDHVGGNAINLTSRVYGENLIWDVPDGIWRVFVFYKTHNGGTDHYINLIDSASCKVLLDAVYEPHYARYAEDFGKTIAGFFSDEPGLGNIPGNSFDNLIGKKRGNLPWSNQLENMLGVDFIRRLPALWCEYGTKEETAAIRTKFMNCLTVLVKTCFSEQIGNWCHERGVEYIGHIIEDNNASECMGCSTGHYFRSLWGQDMAGIDDIGAQITMGGADVEHLSFAGSGDGEFYHHVLGKLGSSLAHIDSKKKDRCVCECFGAYGWSEGTQLMKYIVDHLLADGVNHFVPHAFSARQFPDMDCPPHFYAGGEDILFTAFGKLMGYLNRVSHVLSGYRHTASVAVLYHAEAAWSGGRYMKMQKVARVLREHQIDFDILPSDMLKQDHGKLNVNSRVYEALVIPGCEFLPESVMELCQNARYPVYFAGFAPEGMSAVPLSELPLLLQEKASVHLSQSHKSIRVYHGIHDDAHAYFLFNSSPWEAFEGDIGRTVNYRYDAMENKLYRFNGKLKLAPNESVVLLSTDKELPALDEPKDTAEMIYIETNWLTSCLQNGKFVHCGETAELVGFDKPGYSGTIRYEATVDLNITSDRILLELPQVREVASVWCNDCFVGNTISAPFVFDITNSWQSGKNHLRIEVTTTMEQKVFTASGGRDLFTAIQKVWPAYGLVGSPVLHYL